MKTKILAIILMLCLVLGITACNLTPKPDGGSENPPSTDNTPEDEVPEDDPTGEETPEEEENPNEEEQTVKVTSLTLEGAKVDFAFGEEFARGGLKVTANMSDGSTKEIKSSDYTLTVKDYNSMKVGNYQVNVKMKKTNVSATYDITVSPANKLKVLMIGNSFADDTINYAYEIAKNSGIPAENIVIADIYIGGCSIDTHWSKAQNNSPDYVFNLDKDGNFTAHKNWTMEDAIMYTNWDFITFQQNSGNSGKSSTYSNLQKLMDYVYDVATDTINNPNANPDVKFVWHQTWAYSKNATSSAFTAYGKDQMTMYNSILSCMQEHVLTKNFVAVIPNGTAIQNARTSFIGDNFSRDQYEHLTHDGGRYIASLGLVGTLTGRDMSKITWKPADSGFNYTMSKSVIDVCKESYANAAANFLEITPSKYLSDNSGNETMDAIFEAFEGQGTQADPFLIQSAEDMWALSDITRGINFGDSNIYFKLTADIDLSAKNWNPICASANTGWVTSANSFNANFDGNGKTITFVGNYTGDTWAKGLFSGIGGYVHDLTLRGSITMDKGRVGSLASMALTGAKIENITSYVNITSGNNQVGGIIGYIANDNVTLKNCVNYGTITARQLVGGIVGGSWKNTTYIDCVNHGSITATSAEVGGIVGEKYSSATMTNCSNDGVITAGGKTATSDTGSADSYVGYLVGHQY